MKKRIYSVVTTVLLLIGIFAIALDVVPKILEKPKDVVVTVSASVYWQPAEVIIERSDLIVEVEILDSLTKENSVFIMGNNFPGDIADFYSLRRVKVTNVISESSSIGKGEIINIIEPVAKRESTSGDLIYELDCYLYKTSLKKGQKVTLFLELMENGYYSIMAGGNAQINSELSNGYTAVLDIAINSKNIDDEVLELVMKAVYGGPITCFYDTKMVAIDTEQHSYEINYRYIPEYNNTYLEINGVPYIVR